MLPSTNQDQNIARDLKKVLADANQTVPDFLESGASGAGDNYGTSNSVNPPAHGGGGDDEEW